jgi:hypothetical protein
MTSKPRTIDNLGLEASIRYARDQKLFEARFIEESQIVSTKSQIPVSKPYVPSEFDQLFTSPKTLVWATFSPPPETLSNVTELFSYQLIPSLGTYEQHEDLELLLEDALERKRQSKQKQSNKEKQQEEKEKQLIKNLLQCIAKIDKTLSLINSRRNQYQRG